MTGVVLLLGSAVLALRLVYEMTSLSWERGPQMVGFSLLHGSPLLFLCPVLLIAWLIVAILVVLWTVRRRARPSNQSLIAIALSIAVLGILQLPYGFWLGLYVERWADGPHAGKFLSMAASTGDVALVKTLVERGKPVESRDPRQAALRAAAIAGRVDVIEYLLASGADVNALDHLGDSPLQNALAGQRTEAAQLLAEHGGKIIHFGEQRPQ
jgi:Ankyrin repeats (3 copies)